MATISPAGSQFAFRAALDALARPGTVRHLSGPDGVSAADGIPAALLPLLALADLTTPACVLADDGEWAEMVRVMTSAPMAKLADARLVSVLRPLRDGELDSLRTGTPAAPEDGALACLAVTEFGTGSSLRLTGPGIPGSRELRVAGLPPGFADCRRRLVRGFPAGADLLLVTPEGGLAGLPRTTAISEEMSLWGIRE